MLFALRLVRPGETPPRRRRAITRGPYPPMIEAAVWRPSSPMIATPPSPDCRACVIIPVRDEAVTLWATLGALAGQVDRESRPLGRALFEVIVLANNCRDSSAGIARRFGAANPGLALHVLEVELPSVAAHVGSARRLLMDEACRRLLEAGRPRGVIASTDGDTRVDPGWLAATWDEVDRGADAVGGDIRTDRAGRSALGPWARRAYLADVTYRRLLAELESRIDPDPADPWPRHHHHTGASLGVTAEAYRRAGGLPPLRSSEDLALVRALRRSGHAIRHSPAVRVVTSARRLGRAPGGMADTLRQWSDTSRLPRVESTHSAEARFARSRRLREGSPTLDASTGEDLVEIGDAIDGLRRRLAVLRRADIAYASLPTLLEQVDPIALLAAPA